MTSANESQHRGRAVRMYVKLSGQQAVRGGYTRFLGPKSGFVACQSEFSVGEKLEMELMLNPKHSAGVKVTARVSRSNSDGASTGEQEAGVDLEWIEGRAIRSKAVLRRFLTRVLGLSDPAVDDKGAGPFVYRHFFQQETKRHVPNAMSALKARPTGRGRRSVVASDHALDATSRFESLDDEAIVEDSDALLDASETSLRESASAAAPIVEDELPPLVHPEPPKAPSRSTVVTPTPASLSRAEQIVTGRFGAIEERRGRPRINMALPVSYFERTQGVVGRVHNVSRSGLYVQCSKAPPKVGMRINVRFPIRQGGRLHVVLLTCEVIRHRGSREKHGTRNGFAVAYKVIDEMGRIGIFQHFINQHLAIPD